MRLITSTAIALAVAATTAQAETEISFALWGSPQEAAVWASIAEAFEAAHPDITVNIEVSDWDGYWEKLRVQVAGGTPPDVFAMDAPLYPDWQLRNVLLDLQPYIDADPSVLDGVFPVTLEAYQTDTGLFGVPRDFQTIVLYYNKDMFDAAGVDYPDDSWTWDDFRTAAAALTLDKDGDGTTDQWGAWAEVYDMEPFWGPVIWSHGGEVVDPASGQTLINSPEAMAGFEFIQQVWLEDQSMPTEEQLSQYGWDGLLSGIAAMGFSGHWSVPEYAEAGLNFDVAPVPMGPAGRVTGVNSAGFVISSDTEAPDAAWEFVKYAISEEGQSQLANIGLAVPILEDVAQSDAYLEQPVQINHALFVEALEYAHMKPVFRGYEEWSGAVGDSLNLAWTGEESLADALDEAVALGDDALARNN
ncbi:multiple sugar transport system substrate-binding protein [Yoonia maricola]|uniref:sn-glycerol-3-phosphate-binding periplasmic protein UgpB n=1 Tax=Yoonia maricola TaxID=420999 RepID=A0A2M8WLQ6_9RHOB|nr:sugar ABC transporter substrate-binding protein [Yoonia maricola]PJI91864.1 multiple sugar transport system substrate-binding protein [Yoonia maricola]